MTDDATALVTGGSGAIGRATAEALADDGLNVAVGYFRDESAALESATAVEARGQKATAVQGDVSDRTDASRLVDAALELGPLCTVVNAAGVVDPGSIDDAPTSLERTLAVNVEGAVNVTAEAIDYLRKTDGNVVNVASVAATIGSVDTTYATSKAGLLGFTRALAREVGPDGVRVNAVAPGPVDTPMNDVITESLEDRRFRGHHTVDTLLDRYEATPEEVADAVRFVASHEFITGEVLHVDGGMSV
ncbi:SDR family NAD(P)-dependent oxidoreductase [Natrialbaceae archaeon AArc-T1-2]|uniref:SDR family NAD(P)-dependent oxidoreductase n=1 Tax=Natrialbaceae archaeon AArc-T1-2 TaxID=3053904 RepID=UPI00255A968F|nr:SDR family oxidoreductase [Natrialbaceae archaeon AArc-T1-2]WIV65914.1 SDR family oxidoreductase [Natrialbaceae archaeon AArc-T1-2]